MCHGRLPAVYGAGRLTHDRTVAVGDGQRAGEERRRRGELRGISTVRLRFVLSASFVESLSPTAAGSGPISGLGQIVRIRFWFAREQRDQRSGRTFPARDLPKIQVSQR